jgi:hypothetical protein
MTVSPAEASDAGQASIEHTETLFEGTFAAEHAGPGQAAEISRWQATDAAGLFATFVRNGTMVDPTLIAQEYVARLLESADPDPRERYIARSARQEAERTLAGVPPEAFLLERKPVLREIRAVTGLMSRSGVKLLAGSDLSFLHPPGFSLHDELVLLMESGVTTADAPRRASRRQSRQPSSGQPLHDAEGRKCASAGRRRAVSGKRSWQTDFQKRPRRY